MEYIEVTWDRPGEVLLFFFIPGICVYYYRVMAIIFVLYIKSDTMAGVEYSSVLYIARCSQ